MVDDPTISPRAATAALWRAAKPILQASWPLGAGTIVFVFYIVAWQTGFPIRPERLTLFAAPPFLGVHLVYAMICASFVTVLFATLGYGGELEHMESLTRPGGGRGQLRAARRILWFTIFFAILALVALLMFRENVVSADACTLHVLHNRAVWHDGIVLAIFLVFVVVDGFTVVAMIHARRAIAKELAVMAAGPPQGLPQKQALERHAAEVELNREFAIQQLALVDVPVLIGAAASIVIVFFAPDLSDWDNTLLYLREQVKDHLTDTRDMSLFRCTGEDLTFEQFKASVTQIFTAGIAMGYLAAHVLMSQLVFIVLNTFHRQKRAALGH